MAIALGTVTTTANKVDRGWRVEFFIDLDTEVQIVMHREIQAKDTTSGQIVSVDRSVLPVKRSQDQIAAKSYSAGGVTATGQQLLQLINKMADTERQIDIDTPPPSP